MPFALSQDSAILGLKPPPELAFLVLVNYESRRFHSPFLS